MDYSSLQLATGCAGQEPSHQKLLYEEYYGILMKVAFRYVSTYEQALELTQNGFLKIFHEFIRFRFDQHIITKETLSEWVKRIFIISLVSHIKSEFKLHMPKPIPEELWKQYDRPFTEMEMIYIKLIKILKGLPTLCRLVFNLYVVDGFTHYEIAEMLGITVVGSKQNLAKAREYCNRLLGSLVIKS